MDLETRIRTSFARQAMMTTLQARVIDIAPGTVSIAAPLSDAVLQQQGLAHGGLTFALGDSAAGYSALSLLTPEQEVVTSELSIHYLAPGLGTRLIARGHVVKPGRRLIVVGAEVYAERDGEETCIATLRGTMVPVAATG